MIKLYYKHLRNLNKFKYVIFILWNDYLTNISDENKCVYQERIYKCMIKLNYHISYVWFFITMLKS